MIVDNNTTLNYKIRITDFRNLYMQENYNARWFPIEFGDLTNQQLCVNNNNEFLYSFDENTNPILPSCLQYINAIEEYQEPKSSSVNAMSIANLYDTTIQHIKYMLKHSFAPCYLNSYVSIGFSDLYWKYIIMPKYPLATENPGDITLSCPYQIISGERIEDIVAIDNNLIVAPTEPNGNNLAVYTILPWRFSPYATNQSVPSPIRDRGVVVQTYTPNVPNAQPIYFHVIKGVTNE
jgi:hypothetical protein